MNPPVYDESEPPYMYIKKVEEYLASLKKTKYKIVMKFVNKLADGYDKKFKSLCDFKNVSYMTDHTHNKKVLKEEGITAAKLLNIEFDFNDLKKSSVFDFLTTITRAIDYSVVKKVYTDKTSYTIINKPPKSKTISCSK